MADALKVLMLVKSQAEAFQKPTAAKRLRAKAKQSARMKRMAKGKRLSVMARFSKQDGNMEGAGFAFNRALQKLSMTLRAKKSPGSPTGGGSFVDQLKMIYDKYDPDGNGLDIEEFKRAMEQEGIPGLDPSMIESVFMILDPDNDGTVTYDEFTYAYFNRRKLRYATEGEAARLKAQADLRNKRRKAAIKKLMFDKFMRERESCLPPADETRTNVKAIEEEMGKISHKAKPAEVMKDFDPDHQSTEDKIAWSFGQQEVPLMGIKKGEMVLIIKKGCGRDRRWCVGMSADRKLWGFFPMWCVDHMTSFLKLHEETKVLQERQKLRDAQRDAAEKSRIEAELAKCSFSPMLTSKAKELGAKKSELVVLPFDARAEQKAVREAFASTGGPPAPAFTLKPGERIEVIDRRIGLNGKWCLGRMPRNTVAGRGKSAMKGVFPRWCIGENSLFHRMHQEMEHIEDRRNAKAEKLRNEREEEFTFHPKTNRRKNLRMLKGYEERREQREQKRIDKHIDHLFKECTFKPKLTKTKHISSRERGENSYMRQKEKDKTLPMPRLNEMGRLQEPTYAYIVKPFQWKRNGAVEQMLMPAFGNKNHPNPLSCYTQDKVMVMDTKCGRDHRWALGKLGKATGVFPMWCLPKQFHGKGHSITKSEEMGDSIAQPNNYGGGYGSPNAPAEPSKTSPAKRSSPLARRKKRAMAKHQRGVSQRNFGYIGNGGGGAKGDVGGSGGSDDMMFGSFDSVGIDSSFDDKSPQQAHGGGTSAQERIRQRAEMTKELPNMFKQIQKGLRNRASSLQKAFRMLDTDSSKVVNRHEFKAWLKKYGLVKVKPGQNLDRSMDLMFEQMDVDRDGQITFNEFARKLRTVK